MSKKGNEEVIEMACLGRPFRMGMLYDARSDMLIPGVSLWGEQKLMNALKPTPQIGSDFEVVAEDSLESKALHLDIGASLKLSFLGDMVEVTGSAKYLYDRKSSKQQSRVSLKYWSTTKFEQLSMDQLATEHIEYPEVFEKKTATHVVTGILYGADAIFVFDRNVEEGESTHDVHGKMEVLIKTLPGLTEIKGEAELNMNFEDKKEANKLTCKFHGDLKLKKNPTTFANAVAVYQQLPELLVGDDGPIDVPKKVWLYPLSKLNSEAAKLVHEISISFVHQAQTIMEELLDLNVRSSDLLKTKACSHFMGIQTQLSKFKGIVSEYKTTFSKELKQILPTVREGKPEMKLAELFESKNRSPFNSQAMAEWMKDKEQEIKVLGAYIKMMQDIEFALSPGDLNANIFEHDLVLCFSLKVASSASDYLDKMQAFLRLQDSGNTSAETVARSWFKDREVMATMRQKAKRFATFAKANKENDIKFVVADSSEEGSGFSCAILLYDNGREHEFEPPSAPCNIDAPRGGVTPSSIRLEWSKPEYGAENVKFYTVSYCQENDPSESWDTLKTKGKDTTMTVDNLQENRGYYFKVRAKSKVGSTQYSEVSDMIVTTSKKDLTLSWGMIRDEIYEDRFLNNTSLPPQKTSTTMATKFHRGNLEMIVTIDYGTTYCSVYYALYPKEEEGRLMKFGSEASDSYADKGEEERKNFFYFEHVKKFFKHQDHRCYGARRIMSALKEVSLTRTTTVNDIGGSSFYLRDVIAHALHFLKEKVLESLRKRKPNLKASDLDWVITVPAIWNAQGKQMMREAGYQAGLCSDGSPSPLKSKHTARNPSRIDEASPDKLSLALEPEVAAIHCQKAIPTTKSLSCYVIVDAGGGTVDIACHEVVDDKKQIKELPLTPEQSEIFCGGTSVNEEFQRFIEEMLGDPGFKIQEPDNEDENLEWQAEINRLVYHTFESKKIEFGHQESDSNDKHYPIVIPNILCEVYGDDHIVKKAKVIGVQAEVRRRKVTLKLSPEKMASFFSAPTYETANVLVSILRTYGSKIDRIYLVGGFGGCTYFRQQVQEKTRKMIGRRVDFQSPPEPGLAVALGATAWRIAILKYNSGN